MTSPADFDPETRARLALHLIPGIGVHLTKALIERFGSAEKALCATVEELRTVPRLGVERAQQVAASAHDANLAKEIALLEKDQVQLIPLGAPEYPGSLAAIGAPPAFLYIRGALTAKDGRAIAIVGARSCTDYGKRTAERL